MHGVRRHTEPPEAALAQYARRAQAHRAAGGGPSPIRPPPCGARRAGSPGLTRQPYFSRKAVAGSAPGGHVTASHYVSLHLGAAHIDDFDFSQFSLFFQFFSENGYDPKTYWYLGAGGRP